MGFLYHVNYLEYFEIARSDWIRAFWKSYREIEDEGFALVVIEASLAYFHPARYDEILNVQASLTEWGRSRLVFEYQITRADDNLLLCTGRTAHCFIEKNGKPTRMPEPLRELLDKHRR
jgi:acyl-CoA thioester hydrolase